MHTELTTIRKPRAALILSAFVLGLANLANATLVNVDMVAMGDTVYTGTGVAPDGGTFWNSYTWENDAPGAISSLKLSDGTTTTGIGFSISGKLQNGGYQGNSPTYHNLLDDYAFTASFFDPPQITFALSGLDAGRTYNLYLYSTGGTYAQGAVFTVNGVPGTKSSTGGNNTTFIQGANYVLFTNLTVDVNQQITGSFVNGVSGYGAFNGFQLEAVPEPSTVALFGLGGLLIFRRRARGDGGQGRRRWRIIPAPGIRRG